MDFVFLLLDIWTASRVDIQRPRISWCSSNSLWRWGRSFLSGTLFWSGTEFFNAKVAVRKHINCRAVITMIHMLCRADDQEMSRVESIRQYPVEAETNLFFTSHLWQGVALTSSLVASVWFAHLMLGTFLGLHWGVEELLIVGHYG